MPTYDYRCDACGHETEIFQSMSEKPVRTCPKCRSRRFKRLIGAGAAVIFKGSGFYGTDYRSESYKSGKKKESPEKKKESKPEKTCAGNPSSCNGPSCSGDD